MCFCVICHGRRLRAVLCYEIDHVLMCKNVLMFANCLPSLLRNLKFVGRCLGRISEVYGDEGWKPESPSLAVNPPKLVRVVKFPKFHQPLRNCPCSTSI